MDTSWAIRGKATTRHTFTQVQTHVHVWEQTRIGRRTHRQRTTAGRVSFAEYFLFWAGLY